MLYRPMNVLEIWDTWLYYENGIHYLFTLHKSGKVSAEMWDGISLSTSKDGVHFEEKGIIIEKQPDAEWLGTGSTWRMGEKYYLNFSECRKGVQSIFFAESDDLLHWRILENSECKPDPRWYDVTPSGRWDCIWTVPLPEGGYVGYLTAVPLRGGPGRVGASVGMVASDDGIHWRAVPPPVFDWGDMPSLDLYEVGAIERFGGCYHMMVGMGEERLGNRQMWLGQGGQFGMYHFVADDPCGPFRPARDSFRILCSPDWMTYFTRFYPRPNEMLVCHHSCERTQESREIYLAPLKGVRVDGENMYLCWWTGNEGMLKAPNSLSLEKLKPVYEARGIQWSVDRGLLVMEQNVGGAILEFDEHFCPDEGVAIELRFMLQPEAGRMGSVGLWLGTPNGRFAMLMESRGRTVLGQFGDNGHFKAQNVVEYGAVSGKWHRAQLLVRHSLIELYLDDRLVQCYSLPAKPDGSFGLVLESALIQVESVALREMCVSSTQKEGVQ